MQYIYADIHIHPFSEAACDILSASLGEIGYDSFEHTPTGINAYISEENFNDADLQDVFDHFFIPDTSFTFSIKRLEKEQSGQTGSTVDRRFLDDRGTLGTWSWKR